MTAQAKMKREATEDIWLEPVVGLCDWNGSGFDCVVYHAALDLD